VYEVIILRNKQLTMRFHDALWALSLGSLAAAVPILQIREATAASIIQQISPASASCAGAPAAGECVTADQAAPYLISAMVNYKLYSPGQIAAVLSLIAFETGDLKYNKNHYPGRPGQGTRNMQMPQYNLLYARSIPELAPMANAITTGSADSLSTDQLNSLLALVLPDQYSWASAAWFLTSQCNPSVASGLESATDAAYSAYLSCVGTAASSDRMAYWQRAKAAFGLP
jgi:hypothetical protein